MKTQDINAQIEAFFQSGGKVKQCAEGDTATDDFKKLSVVGWEGFEPSKAQAKRFTVSPR